MFGNWLKRKMQLKAVQAGREDMERFILGLRGASGSEIGIIVAQATVMRMRLRKDNLLPDAALDIGMPITEEERSQIQTFLGSTIRFFQKEELPSDAVGTMVWLHSMRAFTYPELRLQGREMWQQLQRGFVFAEEALEGFESITGDPVPSDAYDNLDFVPPGLEPNSV